MIRGIFIRENNRENTVLPAKACGLILSLPTENVPTAEEK